MRTSEASNDSEDLDVESIASEVAEEDSDDDDFEDGCANNKSSVKKPKSNLSTSGPLRDSKTPGKRFQSSSSLEPSAQKKLCTKSPPASGSTDCTSENAGFTSSLSKKTPEEAVRDYMRQTNRPYSIVNIYDNLQKKIPRPMVQKILDQLVGKGDLKLKEYGKAVIYYYNQCNLEDEFGEVTPCKLQALTDETKMLTEQLHGIQKSLQEICAQNTSLSSQPADDSVDEMLANLIQANDAEEERISRLHNAQGGNSTDPKALENARSKFNKMRSLWLERKTTAMDWIDRISDGMDKKPSVVMDLMGVDPDTKTLIPEKMT